MAQGDIIESLFGMVINLFGWIFGKLIDLAIWLVKITFMLLGSLISVASKGAYLKINEFLNRNRSKEKNQEVGALSIQGETLANDKDKKGKNGLFSMVVVAVAATAFIIMFKPKSDPEIAPYNQITTNDFAAANQSIEPVVEDEIYSKQKAIDVDVLLEEEKQTYAPISKEKAEIVEQERQIPESPEIKYDETKEVDLPANATNITSVSRSYSIGQSVEGGTVYSVSNGKAKIFKILNNWQGRKYSAAIQQCDALGNGWEAVSASDIMEIAGRYKSKLMISVWVNNGSCYDYNQGEIRSNVDQSSSLLVVATKEIQE